MEDFSRIFARKANCAVNVTRQILDGFVEAMEECLARGERVHITGFGTFFVSDVPARDQYDPNTCTIRTAPAFKQVRFKQSKKLRSYIEGYDLVWDSELGYGVDEESEEEDEA